MPGDTVFTPSLETSFSTPSQRPSFAPEGHSTPAGWTLVTETPGSSAYRQVLRSKGFFTLASRPWVTGLWPQAGSVARFEPSSARDTRQPLCAGTRLHRPQVDAELLRADLNGCLMQEGVALPASDLPCLAHLRLLRELRMSTTPSPR
ncbi:hypothetical protein GCM10010228_64850 [Streptomyces massasporeus]|nr:hypothetical protein GCM10010228_64850 [Streptomyces massasporeus]